MTDLTPTADDLALDLREMLAWLADWDTAARTERLHGADASAPARVGLALCRRLIAAERENKRLRDREAELEQKLRDAATERLALLSRIVMLEAPLAGPCSLLVLADDGCPHHPSEEDDCA